MAESVSVHVERASSATPAAVYDVLMDVDRWAEWMPTVSAASWEERGAPDTGLGGIRRVRNGPSVTRDRIVGGTRPTHHAYAASTPRWMLIKDYRGDVRIEESENGIIDHLDGDMHAACRRPHQTVQSAAAIGVHPNSGGTG